MSECDNSKDLKHHHRGKSSESVLDKKIILDSLKIAPGEIILDAGCGNGYMTKEFAKLTGSSGRVYALDPDSASIDILKSETEGTNIEPSVGDITAKTKLAGSSLDLIYLATVVHGFSERQMEGFRQEVKRLLKPTGRLAVVEIKKTDTPFGPPLDMRFSPEELKQKINLTPETSIEVGQFFYMCIFKK